MNEVKKYYFVFILIFIFLQGFFLSSAISIGIYKKKVLPTIRAQHQQIHQMKDYIEHMQNRSGNSQKKCMKSTELKQV